MIFCLILSFGYPCWFPTNTLIQRQISRTSDRLFGLCKRHSDCLYFRHFLGYQNKDYINLHKNKKRVSSIDLDIHNFEVFSSVKLYFTVQDCGGQDVEDVFPPPGASGVENMDEDPAETRFNIFSKLFIISKIPNSGKMYSI